MTETVHVDVRKYPGDNWLLLALVSYLGRASATEGPIQVPAGFVTDWASVPRPFRWLIPKSGAWDVAAVIHDWLCTVARRMKNLRGQVEVPVLDDYGRYVYHQTLWRSRRDADGIFRRILRESGVPFVLRWWMWAAVRSAWDSHMSGATLKEWGQYLLCVLGFLLSFMWVPTIILMPWLWFFDLLNWIGRVRR